MTSAARVGYARSASPVRLRFDQSESFESDVVSEGGAVAQRVFRTARLHAGAPRVLVCRFAALDDDAEGNRLAESAESGVRSEGQEESSELEAGGEREERRGRDTLSRRRAQYVADELCRVFQEQNVGWKWQAATLPAPPPTGAHEAAPFSAGKGGGGGGGGGEKRDHSGGDDKFDHPSGGAHVSAGASARGEVGLSVEVESDDECAGENAAAEGNRELLATLLGAWVVVAVVGEEWDAAGGKGGSGGRGGRYRECRRLLHESNRFVLVVRLHRELPPEMLPVISACFV